MIDELTAVPDAKELKQIEKNEDINELEEHNKEIIDRMRDCYREQEDVGVLYR